MSTPEHRRDSPPERFARILSYAPEIAEAVRKLSTQGYDSTAIQWAVLWSEDEGRLSVQRVRDRTRMLNKQPDLIYDPRR